MTLETYKFAFQDVLISWSPFEVRQPSPVYNDYTAAVDREFLRKGKLIGLCNISGTPTTFNIAHNHLRETVGAVSSGSNNRQRQLVCAISIGLFNHAYATVEEISQYINFYNLKIYTAEANGAVFSTLKRFVKPSLFYYSEYFGSDCQPGQMVNGVRHEDLQRISFADESFDIILSAEVFEHIPDALSAEREIVRILKKGGLYCFTVPFMPYAEQDDVRASLDANGLIIYHVPPEYHGNPVHPESGSLVYRVFSQRGMEERYSKLGCEFITYHLWSRMMGILGYGMVVHMVRKLPKYTFRPMPTREFWINP